MKHVHHDLIQEWIKDTSRVVEEYSSTAERWLIVPRPNWNPAIKYRFKPAEPKFITVNGVNVPEPVRGGLVDGQQVWIADACSGTDVCAGASTARWHNSNRGFAQWLSLGLIHLTKEAAQAHIDAMLLPSRSDK
jgi:hypothetical protein